MKCSNCGKKVKKEGTYCLSCGKEIMREPKVKQKLSKKAKVIISVVCSIAILISGIIGGLYFYFSRNDIPTDPDSIYVSFSEGFTDVTVTDENSALEAIASVADVIGIKNAEKELKISSTNTVNGDTYYRFGQYYEGISVYGRDVVIAADNDGTALALTGNFAKIENIKKYDLDEIDKDSVVVYGLDPAKICTVSYENIDGEEYCVFTDVKSKEVVDRLCMTYTASEKSYPYRETDGSYSMYDSKRNIRILNSKGKELEKTDFLLIGDGKYQRTFYTGKNKDKRQNVFSGHWGKYEVEYIVNDNISVVKSNTADGFDSSATKLMDNMALTYDFYLEKLGRSGFDGSNGLIFASYNDNYDNGNNAYASGGSLLSFGKHSTLSVDLIAHEYTHSVERMISSMSYEGESGAIMEGYSDIFGEIVEDYSDGQMDNDCDWVNPYRNIIEPLKTNNPNTYEGENWKDTENKVNKKGKTQNDHGNVHNNSTVISYAAYLMNIGIDGTESKKIGTETLADLWYRALFILQSDATFKQLANNITLIATHMVRTGELSPNQLQCVLEAFDKVGIQNDKSYSTIKSGAKLYVNDIYLNAYDNYHVTITEMPKIQDYLSNKKLGKIVIDTDVLSTDGFSLDLNPGNYLISLKDNCENGSKNEFSRIIKVIDSTYRNRYTLTTDNITVFTDFGKAINRLTDFVGLSIDEWETIMYSIYETDYSVTESSSWIPDAEGSDRILYYDNRRIPVSFLTNVGSSTSTIPSATDTISAVCFEQGNRGNMYSVDGNINTDVTYSKLNELKDGILWQNELYVFTYKVGDISIDFEYYDRPTDDSVADFIYVSKRDWNPEYEGFDDDYKESDKKYLSDMPIIKESHYEGNMGDSRIFLLNNPNDSSIDSSAYSNGNIALDGTVCENGFEAWLARWNYEPEISWASATFKLDGDYSKLTGKINITDGPRADGNNWDDFDTTVYFYDGNSLLASYNLTPDNYKKDINIDISGVKELTIFVKDNVAVSTGTSFALYEMLLE